MVLELAHALDLIVANTWFTKAKSKKITYESGGSRTVVDYVLVRTGHADHSNQVEIITLAMEIRVSIVSGCLEIDSIIFA
jgi:hypothetical protein